MPGPLIAAAARAAAGTAVRAAARSAVTRPLVAAERFLPRAARAGLAASDYAATSPRRLLNSNAIFNLQALDSLFSQWAPDVTHKITAEAVGAPGTPLNVVLHLCL